MAGSVQPAREIVEVWAGRPSRGGSSPRWAAAVDQRLIATPRLAASWAIGKPEKEGERITASRAGCSISFAL
jgi:hypothetical protein